MAGAIPTVMGDGTVTQNEHLIAVQTPLGQDYFILTGFSGQETVSRLFEFDLDMLSHDLAVDPTQLVGMNVTFSVMPREGDRTFFNGFVSHFVAGEIPTNFRGRQYNIHVVPWMWFLTRAANSRIFQNMNVVDIVKKIFTDHGFNDFEFRTQGTYQPYEYKVQYDETDFNFVSRLLEHEGIFYFFKHENGRHTAIFGDAPSVFQPGPVSSVPYISEPGWERIHGWQHNYEFRPGKWTLTDYDFTKPQTDLTANQPTMVQVPFMKQFEFFEYPGCYLDKDAGSTLARTRIEMEEAEYHVVNGQGMVTSFRTGQTFGLSDSDLIPGEAGAQYALLSVSHSAHDITHITRGEANSLYSNAFIALPSQTKYRPPRLTHTPIIHGPQTAVVVGRSGDEIYTDKYGRIKVQFRWDRYGKADENSSLFIRVVQNWSGNKWGGNIIPRVGMEVVVEFLEGDPDKPIVTGCVYNASAMPPDTLPDNKTRSVFRTHSSPQASGFNEISFEDKAGSEQIFVHGEHNQDVRIKNDAQEWIGNNRSLMVQKDQLEKVAGDKHLQVAGNHNEKVQGTASLEIAGDHNEKVDGKQSLTVGSDQNEKVGGTLSLSVGSDWQQKIGSNSVLSAGQQIVLDAGMEITLKVGGNFITIGPTGVTIVGTMVLINSGGAPSGLTANPTSPTNPTAPKDPTEADDRQSGSNPPGALTGTPPEAGSTPGLTTETFS